MNNILYKVIYGIFYALSMLPFRVLYCISDIEYVFVFHIIRYRRRIVRSNLTSAFPEKTISEIRTIERKFYHWFCDYFFETIKMLSMSDEEMRRRFFISNAKEIEQCFERGQDAAGMLGHFCNWEWLSRFGIYLPENRRVGLIYHPLRNKLFDKLFYNIRKTDSGVLIPMKRVPKILLQMKRDGYMNICGYISDQAPKWQNIHLWLPFFNHETPVFTGGERIMRKMNNAVYYLEMSRVKRGYYRCEYRLITQNAKDTEEFEITRSFFRMLEENVRRQPECYLWSHNRWKRTREEFDQRFKTENGKVILKEN